MVVVCVKLPKELVDAIDAVVRENNYYISRSDFIREAVRLLLASYSNTDRVKKKRNGRVKCIVI